MKGAEMKLTEAEVRLAIEYWFNRAVCQHLSHTPHPIESVTAMPRSDNFCLTVKFK